MCDLNRYYEFVLHPILFSYFIISFIYIFIYIVLFWIVDAEYKCSQSVKILVYQRPVKIAL